MIGNCQLSGKQTTACVLIRCKGRGGVHFTISSAFTPFLLRLWTVYRMDMLIKLYTRYPQRPFCAPLLCRANL